MSDDRDPSIVAEFRPSRYFRRTCYAAAVLCTPFVALPLFAITIPECRTTFGYFSAFFGPALGGFAIYTCVTTARRAHLMRAIVRRDGIAFEGAYPASWRSFRWNEIRGVGRGIDDEILVRLPYGYNYTPDINLFGGKDARDEFQRIANDLVASQTTALKNA